MTIRSIPIWVRWAVSVLILWCVWGFGARPVVTHRLHISNQQHDDLERQLAALRMQVGQVPMIQQRIDSCRYRIDSYLAGFAGSQDVDALTDRLCATGGRHGLNDVHAEPELNGLLNASRSPSPSPSSQIRLDTIVIALSAKGQFFALGAWLDEIERWPDFRTWISCHWSRSDDDNGVGFDGKAILLLADRRDPAADTMIGGM